jgi:hypothetical protein
MSCTVIGRYQHLRGTCSALVSWCFETHWQYWLKFPMNGDNPSCLNSLKHCSCLKFYPQVCLSQTEERCCSISWILIDFMYLNLEGGLFLWNENTVLLCLELSNVWIIVGNRCGKCLALCQLAECISPLSCRQVVPFATFLFSSLLHCMFSSLKS